MSDGRDNGLDFEARREAIKARSWDELKEALSQPRPGEALGWVQALHEATAAVLGAHGNPQFRLSLKPEPEVGSEGDARRLRALLRFMERRQDVACGLFEAIVSDKGIQVAWASPVESDTLPEFYEFHARSASAAWGYADLLTLALFQVARDRLPADQLDALLQEAEAVAASAINPHIRTEGEGAPS